MSTEQTYRFQFMKNYMFIKNDTLDKDECHNRIPGSAVYWERLDSLCCELVDNDKKLDHCRLRKEYVSNYEVTDLNHESQLTYNYVIYPDQVFSYRSFFENVYKEIVFFPYYPTKPKFELWGRNYINFIFVIKNPSDTESINIDHIYVQENKDDTYDFLDWVESISGFCVFIFVIIPIFLIFPLCVCCICCNFCFLCVLPSTREGREFKKKDLIFCCLWIHKVEELHDVFVWLHDRCVFNRFLCNCFCLFGPWYYCGRCFHHVRLFTHFYHDNHFCCSLCGCCLFGCCCCFPWCNDGKYEYYFGKRKSCGFLCRELCRLVVLIVLVFLVQTLILDYYVHSIIPVNYCGVHTRCSQYKSKNDTINENHEPLTIIGRSPGDESVVFDPGEAFLLERKSISTYTIFGMYPTPYEQCLASEFSFLSCQIENALPDDGRPICPDDDNENLDLWFRNTPCNFVADYFGNLGIKIVVIILTRILVIPCVSAFGCCLTRFKVKNSWKCWNIWNHCLCCCCVWIALLILILMTFNILQYMTLRTTSEATVNDILQFLLVLSLMTFFKDYVEVPIKFYLKMQWKNIEEFKNSGYDGITVTEKEKKKQRKENRRLRNDIKKMKKERKGKEDSGSLSSPLLDERSHSINSINGDIQPVKLMDKEEEEIVKEDDEIMEGGGDTSMFNPSEEVSSSQIDETSTENLAVSETFFEFNEENDEPYNQMKEL